jgi:hypothetical protein
MPSSPTRNPREKQVSAWRTATIIPSIANSGTPTTKVDMVRTVRSATSVSEMDNRDLRRALRKLELSDMNPLDAYNLWLREYIMQGGAPTYYHDEPFKERHCKVYQDAQGVIWVETSSSGRVLGRLVFTWEHGKAVSSEPKYIPAYSDTVDKLLMERNNSVAWRLRKSRAQWDEMFADARARWVRAQDIA